MLKLCNSEWHTAGGGDAHEGCGGGRADRARAAGLHHAEGDQADGDDHVVRRDGVRRARADRAPAEGRRHCAQRAHLRGARLSPAQGVRGARQHVHRLQAH